MKGTTVCRAHGGAARQTLAAARARLLAAADPLMAELISLAQNKKLDASVRLRAIADALDRAGLGAKQALEITVAPWQEALLEVVGDEKEFKIVPGEVVGHGPRALLHDDAETSNSTPTRDSELRHRNVQGFEGTNRLHRTGAHHDDPPHPAARRRRHHG